MKHRRGSDQATSLGSRNGSVSQSSSYIGPEQHCHLPFEAVRELELLLHGVDDFPPLVWLLSKTGR